MMMDEETVHSTYILRENSFDLDRTQTLQFIDEIRGSFCR